MPRRAQIDARRGVAVQPRQVISDEHASRVLNISVVERRSERLLILEGKLLAPWVTELRVRSKTTSQFLARWPDSVVPLR
jgi:hypothetical protein